ncbi:MULTISPECIES: peptidase inhibitor family I36 protein [unclassified Streptomyces]|uniref:peptidase inhibitor family I36 protein n=1 Tax=unclassified Streptomyces TaxID=2593676 RepID=UPI0023666564|nr:MULTISPECIES: peptidase inhibitor family I36 protein [unclassified Streptomyces]MDF3139975.1 peptidase inhibitor family I36 protein [Streptomyces sp. T21Q-yed]WDF39885.1 peptidase inhibitor family I36 protein [Streptomyces sp. T12]
MAALAMTAAATPASAQTAPDSLQREIDQVIAEKGGVQISRYGIAWKDDGVILAFPLPGEEAAPPPSNAAQEIQVKAAEQEAAERGLPRSAARIEPRATRVGGCPTETFGNDWYCFYDGTNYGGRRLQWNATHSKRVDFNPYDFRDKTTSWVNGGGLTVRVYNYNNACSNGVCRLWTENAHSSSTGVATSLNNKADFFTAT